MNIFIHNLTYLLFEKHEVNIDKINGIYKMFCIINVKMKEEENQI